MPSSLPNSAKVVVVGSAHAEVPAGQLGSNEARIFVRGHRGALLHKKFQFFGLAARQMRRSSGPHNSLCRTTCIASPAIAPTSVILTEKVVLARV